MLTPLLSFFFKAAKLCAPFELPYSYTLILFVVILSPSFHVYLELQIAALIKDREWKVSDNREFALEGGVAKIYSIFSFDFI
jgi:hypothetical protein